MEQWRGGIEWWPTMAWGTGGEAEALRCFFHEKEKKLWPAAV